MKKESKNLKSITERNSNDKSQDIDTTYIRYELTIKYVQYENKPSFYKELLKLMIKLNLPAVITVQK